MELPGQKKFCGVHEGGDISSTVRKKSGKYILEEGEVPWEESIHLDHQAGKVQGAQATR